MPCLPLSATSSNLTILSKALIERCVRGRDAQYDSATLTWQIQRQLAAALPTASLFLPCIFVAVLQTLIMMHLQPCGALGGTQPASYLSYKGRLLPINATLASRSSVLESLLQQAELQADGRRLVVLDSTQLGYLASSVGPLTPLAIERFLAALAGAALEKHCSEVSAVTLASQISSRHPAPGPISQQGILPLNWWDAVLARNRGEARGAHDTAPPPPARPSAGRPSGAAAAPGRLV